MQTDQKILEKLGCKIMKFVGAGGFGRVYLVKHPKYQNVCAKIINSNDYNTREYKNLMELTGSPHVVKMHGYDDFKYFLYFCRYGKVKLESAVISIIIFSEFVNGGVCIY
jgi:serine/threonine protein kinase